jgi:hypothetical protein
MKSRLFCGGVIWDKHRTKQVGLLMLEATADRYQRTFMEGFMEKQERGYLGELIDVLGG